MQNLQTPESSLNMRNPASLKTASLKATAVPLKATAVPLKATAASLQSDLFVLILRAADIEPRPTWLADRRRIVFLHGWLQDHSCWLALALQLRAVYGHDCLLLDWPAHGRSPAPVPPEALDVDVLVACLRGVLERARWTDGACPLTLCGCSMGGGMAMRYTTEFGGVDRLVLVAPAGFDEPWYRAAPPPSTVPRGLRAVSGWLRSADERDSGTLATASLAALLSLRQGQTPFATAAIGAAAAAIGTTAVGTASASLDRLRAKLQIVATTPRYRVTPNWFDTPAARSVRRTLLVAARFDELHRADRWASCRADDPSFHMRLVPCTHVMACQMLSSSLLGLGRDADAWAETSTALMARARL
tara:strand:+ start:1141 stop:2220 length:1080 start_codon:yes stop_codon:yes gene_type:complete